MFVTGICPLIAWRRATFANLRKNFMYPAAVGVITAVVLVALGMRHVYAIISFSLAAFVLAAVLVEFGRGTWVRREMSGDNVVKALGSLVWRNKRRYGGYTVHVGVILLLIGVTGSYAFKEEAQQTLQKGETITAGAYALTYESMENYETSEKQVGRATFSVTKDGQDVGVVYPVREYYFLKDQPWTRVDRLSTLSKDVYVMLLDYSADTGEVNMEVNINPLIGWLWIGGTIMVLGAVLAIWPDRRDSLRLAARYERQRRLNEI
jgi:cytochrome c-type biogenesis protein CcmF